MAYHLDHARSWVVRLGDGTAESHRRVQAGLDEVWPYAFELFERDELLERLVARGVAADPALLEPQWRATVEDVLAEATLDRARDDLAADRRPPRRAHRRLRLPARRAAAPAPLAPRWRAW